MDARITVDTKKLIIKDYEEVIRSKKTIKEIKNEIKFAKNCAATTILRQDIIQIKLELKKIHVEGSCRVYGRFLKSDRT